MAHGFTRRRSPRRSTVLGRKFVKMQTGVSESVSHFVPVLVITMSPRTSFTKCDLGILVVASFAHLTTRRVNEKRSCVSVVFVHGNAVFGESRVDGFSKMASQMD